MMANRQRGWQVTEEEACRAEDLSSKETWDFILNDAMKASDFKRVLYEGFLSPRGWDGPSLFDMIVGKLLREALEVGKAFVSSPPQGQGGQHCELIVQLPREAIAWISERREDLIPPNLRDYIKSSSPEATPKADTPDTMINVAMSATVTPLPPPVTPNGEALNASACETRPQSRVSPAELERFITARSDGVRKEAEVSALAREHFGKNIPRQMWRDALKKCAKKRRRGQTDRTLSNTPP
jgi:hypothetical protein